MSNDIAKALKQKTDAMLRLQGQSQKTIVYENTDGTHYAPEQADYSAALAQGENIEILNSQNIKTIKAIIPQATETKLGGIKAKAKTTETSEVVIDPETGKLYVPASGEAANGLPSGGMAGQIPIKVDGTDYNVEWGDVPSAEGKIIASPSYLAGTTSGSAYAWKGNMFKPDIAHKLHALGYIGNIVAGATYQAAIVTKTAGNIIETITKSPKKTLPTTLSALSTKCLWFKFDTPITLAVGISYYLMVGRTDSTDTYVLPIPFTGGTGNENAVPMFGLSHGNAGLIAKSNPVVGDAIALSITHSAAQYFLFEQL